MENRLLLIDTLFRVSVGGVCDEVTRYIQRLMLDYHMVLEVMLSGTCPGMTKGECVHKRATTACEVCGIVHQWTSKTPIKQAALTLDYRDMVLTTTMTSASMVVLVMADGCCTLTYTGRSHLISNWRILVRVMDARWREYVCDMPVGHHSVCERWSATLVPIWHLFNRPTVVPLANCLERRFPTRHTLHNL